MIAIDEKNDYTNIYRNYHCEVAEIYLNNDEFKKFNEYLIFIIGKFGSFPRIKLLKFRYFIKTNDIDGIYETWFDLISNNENFIDTLIKELSNFLIENSNDFFSYFFSEKLRKNPSLTLVKSIFKNFDLLKNKNNKTELIEDILKYTKKIEKN